MDETLRELYLGKSMRFPVEKYNQVTPTILIKVERLDDETEEEFFIRAHEKKQKIFEAEAAIEMAEVMRITNNGSIAEYAFSLGERIGANNNKFLNEYLNTFRKE